MEWIEGGDVARCGEGLHVVVYSNVVESGEISKSWGETIESGVCFRRCGSGENVDVG